jgi:hypothetical protein
MDKVPQKPEGRSSPPQKKIESDTFSHAVFSLLDFLRDGTEWFSIKVGKELPFYAA